MSAVAQVALPASAYAATKRRFLEHAPGEAWGAFVASSEDPMLPEDALASGAIRVVRSRASVQAALARCARPAALALPADAADVIAGFAASLDAASLAAFDALVRRALDPFEALATWPLEALFDADELARIHRIPRPRHRVRLRAAPEPREGDADYAGAITAIVKVTRNCNLRCVYCNDWRAEKGQVMTFPVQLRLAEALFTPEEHEHVTFIWHGGEPTLLGRRAFVRLLALQRWFQRPGQVVVNHLQTNATTIDEAWATWLRRYGFIVSISLDGPEHLHDAARPHVSGRPTFEKVRRGLHALRAQGIRVGVGVVVGEAALALGADAIADFLESEEIKSVGLLPVRPAAGPRRLGTSFLSAETFGAFLLAFERRRRRLGGERVRVRELETLRRLTEGEDITYCEMKGNCVGAFFSVDPDGSVAHCDKYVGDEGYVLGNVTTSSFAELRETERARRLAEEARRGQDEYRACAHFEKCRGWCPHERYMAKRYARSQDAGCCGLKGVFEALTGAREAEGTEARDA